MLHELHVRDIALIEDAWLEFGPGMTVLSGETGAGKTALVGALKLLLGERADSTLVRAGAAETLVEGRFSACGDDLLVKRRVGADGRSRCTIGGEMSTVGTLAERVGPLVDLHGQHEHQALLDARSHAGYLDRWAGSAVTCAKSAYVVAFDEHREAVSEFESISRGVAESLRDADYLAFVVEEIDRVDPQPGEDETLAERLPALQHAERLAEAADEAASALRGDSGALDAISTASAALARVAGIDSAIDEMASRIDEIQTLADDVGRTAREYRDAVDHDPAALDGVLARMAVLSGICKKYGPTLGDVLTRREQARTALSVADDGEAVLAEAAKAVEAAASRLRETADTLVAERAASAPGFVEALQSATRDLEMDGVRFEVDFADLPFEAWTREGPHRLEFLLAPAPGQPPRPLVRIASGGEVSRVMLALKGVLGSADTVDTLVFDEIDTGVGGATATAVGRRLAGLARTRQVIVVTHLAQVAVFADEHLVVTKQVTSSGAATSVNAVDGDVRVCEIARMLAGNDSQASRDHARELLEEARAAVTAL